MHFPEHTHPVLFVKLDGIGDYLFFRLFWPQIKDICTQRKWKISFFCSESFLPIVRTYDSSYLANYFCAKDISKYSKDKWLLFLPHHYIRWKRGRFGYPFKKIHYDVIFNMNTVRDNRTEQVIQVTTGLNKQGSSLNANDFIDSDYTFSNDIYTQLHCVSHTQFILNYYKELLEKMFGCSFRLPVLQVPFTHREVTDTLQRFCLNKKYTVLIPFTSTPARNWALKKFLFLATKLLAETDWDVVVLGQCDPTAQAQISSLRGLINLTNKTSLIDAMKLAFGAQYAICSDTSLRHCALIGGAKVITVSSGLTEDLFVKYPLQYSICQKIFMPVIRNKQGVGDINSISEQELWNYILNNWLKQK